MENRSAQNSHFQKKWLYPLFVFTQFSDLERCSVLPVNVHSADGWDHPIRIKGNAKLKERIDWLTKPNRGSPRNHVARLYTGIHYWANCSR